MFIAKPKKLLVVFYFNQPIKKKKQALSDSLSITFNIISDAGIPISPVQPVSNPYKLNSPEFP
ncbi:hypothetical protein KDV46_12710, partial [Providencia stuartii]|uniref:hypothetical protein n=1 Tax=Providencia stuartii TaxID=588 RepID=UPI003322FD6A